MKEWQIKVKYRVLFYKYTIYTVYRRITGFMIKIKEGLNQMNLEY